jgi:hypothetical protein
VSSLDVWLPEYQFSERHSLKSTASDAALWDAVKRVTPDEIGPLRWLMAIRSLPAKAAGTKGRLFAPGTPILDAVVNSSFVLLEECAPREIVLGTAGQFWKLDGGPRVNVRRSADFAAFHEPVHVRAAVNFAIGGGSISTETRIQALDESARRKFGLYWTLIRLGSGWIRMAWLRAIRRRARQQQQQQRP